MIIFKFYPIQYKTFAKVTWQKEDHFDWSAVGWINRFGITAQIIASRAILNRKDPATKRISNRIIKLDKVDVLEKCMK